MATAISVICDHRIPLSECVFCMRIIELARDQWLNGPYAPVYQLGRVSGQDTSAISCPIQASVMCAYPGSKT